MIERITYYQSPIGNIKITGTYEYINTILFIEDTFKNDIEPSGALHQCCAQLDEYFNGTLRTFNLPILKNGTPFQQRVWDELLTIPIGKTISYLQLAKQLGDEKVIRAAASANGKNPLAIIVPCHRVIGSDGSLTGYAGGLKRKQFLLDHEQKLLGKKWSLF
jgi:methylated-DNA-[protein]-cysteine S-methyltransferase